MRNNLKNKNRLANIRYFNNKEEKIFDYINNTILFIILIIVSFPIIFVVVASFSDPFEVAAGNVLIWPVGFQLDGYRRVFESKEIWMGYKNSIIYTTCGVVINLIMTTAGAYPLSRPDLKYKKIFTIIFTFTMFFGGGLIPTYLLINNLGILDTIWVMIIPGAVSVYNMLVMRTYFTSSVPFEIQQSAMMDGCSNIRTFWNIVLPMSVPIYAVMALFYGVGHWNDYFNALIYLSSRSKYPLQMFLREILVQNIVTNYMDESSENIMYMEMMRETLKYCVIIVASVPMLIAYPFIQKYFVYGMKIGALKG